MNAIWGSLIFFVVLFILALPFILTADKGDKEKGNLRKRPDAHPENGPNDDISMVDKLILGAGGAKLIEAEEQYHQERKAAREKKRLEDLNWQDAAREGDEEDW